MSTTRSERFEIAPGAIPPQYSASLLIGLRSTLVGLQRCGDIADNADKLLYINLAIARQSMQTQS